MSYDIVSAQNYLLQFVCPFCKHQNSGPKIHKEDVGHEMYVLEKGKIQMEETYCDKCKRIFKIPVVVVTADDMKNYQKRRRF